MGRRPARRARPDPQSDPGVGQQSLFHVLPYGETTTGGASDGGGSAVPTDFDEGMLVGVLIGEGHFGGDGRQPHVTLRMHERHESLFRWIERTFPGGRLYGPYDHGGRRYYQWMARGAYLRDSLLPLLERRVTPGIDRYAFERFDAMRTRYRRQLRPGAGREGDEISPEAATPGTRMPSRAGPAPEQPAGEATDPAARIFSQLRGTNGGPGPAPR